MTSRAERTPLREVRLATRQATVSGEVMISGVGLFSGDPCRIALRPATEDSGITVDVQGTTIPCTIDHLLPQAVHTSGVGAADVGFRSFEHLLAAFCLLGIQNCEIAALVGDEVPDPSGGSCDAFTVPIRRAGIRSLDAATEAFRIAESGTFSWADSSATYEPVSGPYLELLVHIDFPAPVGRQVARWSSDPASEWHDVPSFERARSFLRRDLADVWPSGNDHLAEARRTVRGLPAETARLQHLAFRNGEWVAAPRFPTEAAWHKLVDLAGDLLLLGRPVLGRVSVRLPGHAFNHRLVHHLLGRPDADLPLTAALH